MLRQEGALTYGGLANHIESAGQWTVPVNVVYTQVLPPGKQIVSIGAGARYYVQAPDNGPEWGLRLVFTLLFPK